MNKNYRIVPSNIYCVSYDHDPVRQIVHQKIIMEHYVIPSIQSSRSYSSEELRKFCTALLMCILITSAFRPRGEDSYCPLSKPM